MKIKEPGWAARKRPVLEELLEALLELTRSPRADEEPLGGLSHILREPPTRADEELPGGRSHRVISDEEPRGGRWAARKRPVLEELLEAARADEEPQSRRGAIGGTFS